MIDQENLVRNKRKRRVVEESHDMNLSEIEKNLEDGEDQMVFLDVDLKNSTDKLLVFRKFPFA